LSDSFNGRIGAVLVIKRLRLSISISTLSILKKVPKAFSRNLNMNRKMRKRLRIIKRRLKRSLPILMRKVIYKSKTAINKKRTKRRRRSKI
jgi:hypothetical protein